MLDLRLGTIIELIIVSGAGVFAAWRGYLRRRAHWSRGSWMGFSLTVLAGLAMIGFALAFSVGVDDHAAWVGAVGSSVRASWIIAALGGLVGGSLLTAGSLTWFAKGEPSRPFSLSGLFARARLHISSDEGKQLSERSRSEEDA